MPREKLRGLIPSVTALFTLGVSFMAYPPEIYPGNPATAVLAACACLGWASIIVFYRERRRAMTIYLFFALTMPMIIRLFPGIFPWNPAWHWVIYSLLPLSFIGLLVFVRLHASTRKSKETR